MANEKIPVVTVIIPMYNSEGYIEQCLQSLLNQTLKNIEVIVVDDCSTDNSFSVAKKMSEQFTLNEDILFVKKLKKNSGCPGVPRNEAINLAKGKYIYFLDSDDFLDSNALEDFYKVAEEFNADVVHAEGYFTHIDDSEENDEFESIQSGELVKIPTLETLDVGKRIEDFINKRYLWWGCNKLFRRDLILKNKIKFSSMTLFEDLFFTFKSVICAKNYVRVPFVSYHYRIREGSLSRNSPLSGQHIRNFIDALDSIDAFMNKQEVFIRNAQYKYSVLDFLVQLYLDATSKNLFIDSNLELTEIYNFLYREVFSVNSSKGATFNSFSFMLMNIYRILVNQQAMEINQLKKIIAELKGD